MNILFSPSEDKNLIYKKNLNIKFDFLNNLFFGLKGFRKNLLNDYLEVLKTHQNSEIAKILGFKITKIDADVLCACNNLDCSNLVESIFLYNGVAFKALNIHTLPQESVEFLYKNLIIFSNLFGPIKASDKIPFYKLKQGQVFKNNDIFKIYTPFKNCLDRYLQNDEVLDLRAKFYIKAYKLDFPHTKVEFYRNGVKSSHYSKYYRGLLLRHIALSKSFTSPFKLINTKFKDYVKILQYDVSDSIIT